MFSFKSYIYYLNIVLAANIDIYNMGKHTSEIEHTLFIDLSYHQS